MFLGHFGVGFGLKRTAPKVSLGTLLLAAQFVDLLWPTLLVLGLERVAVVPGITLVTPLDFQSYPISHSLLMGVGWGLLFGLVYWLIKKYRFGAIVCGFAVVSHWVLDFIVHRPDLPLSPYSETRVGLGVWNSLPGTLILEFAIFGLGLWLYVQSTRPKDRTGVWALWSFVVFLLVSFLGNLFGPPPSGQVAIAWVGHGQWLLIAWAYWIDRHRVPMG